MNRHFRIPPEHQVFWDEIKTGFKPFIPAILFIVIFVVIGLVAFW